MTVLATGTEGKAMTYSVQDLNQMDYERFTKLVEREFLQHPIVVSNRFTQWFASGDVTIPQLRHFAIQFSVFSNLFLIAQLKKMLNADSLESMHQAKEILANELGVIFNHKGKAAPAQSGDNTDQEGDPEFVSTEGTIEGGTFRFGAAHFEWLLKFGKPLGLGFDDLGKRRHGTASTLFFCDELSRLYGSEDASIAAGASFAIENWAAAGFWQELEDGLLKIRKTQVPDLSLAFFAWHNRLEAQHAAHTQEELKEIFEDPRFDRAKFLAGGKEMLEGLAAFWNGLEADRLNGVVA
ncbi:hypothetical protein [Vampirovibrio chlorellavorus]|uniref:hypothetical protein n=1 Tax=Vampirovibrio chlorellavorus TaxID=758823 RepID=UPI0026EB1322|nr:hypothetical protein [Vampirovibrio chlorellavorus]